MIFDSCMAISQCTRIALPFVDVVVQVHAAGDAALILISGNHLAFAILYWSFKRSQSLLELLISVLIPGHSMLGEQNPL